MGQLDRRIAVAIAGSSGSIGTQTLDVVRAEPDHYEVVALAVGSSVDTTTRSTTVARRAAALHVPDPAPAHDALIAATALVHRMTVVTRDVTDFARFDGVRVLDPWSEAVADR